MQLKTLLILALLALGLISEASAQIPTVVSYQGFLSTKDGPFTGTLSASFTLYDSPTGGKQAFNQQSYSIDVSKGYYTVMLDFAQGWQNGYTSFDRTFWLEVFINSQVLTPRVRLTSVPYALNAKHADTADVALKLVQDAPIGTIVAYGGNIFKLSQNEKKLGWYICDGRRIAVNDFPAYADVVQTTYGVSDAADSVYLPDFRGLFLRGVNTGFAGNRTDAFADPDASSRVEMKSGGNNGNKVGSIQSDAVGTHQHDMQFNGTNITGASGAAWGYGPHQWASYGILAGSTAYGGNGNNTSPPVPGIVDGHVSIETRPKNANVYWIIKVK